MDDAKRQSHLRRSSFLAVFLLLLLAVTFTFALKAGTFALDWKDLGNSLLEHLLGGEPTLSRAHEIIIWRIKLPRLLLAILTGMATAVAGTVYQGCFRNPLVEPYLLGASSGAALGASLAVVFPDIFLNGASSAFLFAMSAVMLSFWLARKKHETPAVTLILSGLIVGALFTAFVGIMKYLASDTELREITFWMMGGFYYASWEDVRDVAALAIPCMILLMPMGWKLNILSLGDEEARSLGVFPDRLRLWLIVLSTLAVAVCVAHAGIIAWVGLMIPHAARMLFGPDNRWVLPCSALLGALYLLLCDTAARTLTGAEIPLAIITSIAGAPYLLWLIRTRGKDLYGS